MLGAFLTTIFFSLSSISANRAIRSVGATRANLGRLFVATFLLGLWAHLVPLLSSGSVGGKGFGGAGVLFFFISGVIGMGLGDIAVFAALPLLGARLTVVMTQCLAAPIAAWAEWQWLGTTLTAQQIACSAIILGGVALALTPSPAHPPRVRVRFAGVVYGFLSALGQGLGAVFSRKAYDISAAAGQTIDGMTATYQRIVGGLLITLVYLAFVRALRRDAQTAAPVETQNVAAPRGFRRWRWTLANGVCGPVIGVSCYQWALSTTASGIVLPIVATTPLVVAPFAYWLDGDRPTKRSLIGGAIAVAGAVALSRVR